MDPHKMLPRNETLGCGHAINCVVAALLIPFVASGCAMWQGPRTPNLIAHSREASVDPVPTIKVVFGHEHSMDGDRRKWTEGVSLPVFVNAYNATASKSAVMSSASQKPSKPVHYVLFLDTQVREHGEVAAVIGGLSLMLIPTVTTSDIVVTGSLYEAATGKEVAVHEAKGELKLLIWLPLLPVTPFTLISAPGKELYEDTFRDFFMMLTKDLTGKPLPEAVEPSRIVSEPVPDHPKREIRLK